MGDETPSKRGRPLTAFERKEARGSVKNHPERHREEAEQRAAEARAAVPPRDYTAVIETYARDVIAGRIPAGKFVKLACERHLRELERQAEPDFPYRFDAAAVTKVLSRIERFRHVKGRWAAKRETITLGAWQCFCIGVPFGWLRKRDVRRRFREMYLRVPRKNTKSTMAACIGNYMFLEDGEYGAEVYAGATTEKQAWEVFGPAKLMIERDRALRDEHGIEVWAKALVKGEDNSKFWPVIGKPGDGPSPSCAIVDEYHEHQTSDLVDTMQTGMGAREQPMMVIITTAGVDLASPCYDKDREVQRILEGVVENDELFGAIYSIDEPESKDEKGDDWADPSILAKANPNLGVSVDEEFLKAQQRQAVLNPAYQNRFKTKHLNIWCSAAVAGIPAHQWKLCTDAGLRIEEFKGERCWFILDLASKTDVCAFVQLFLRKLNGANHYYAFGRYYLPEDTIEEAKANQAMYRKWVIQQHLIATPGAEIDFDSVADDVLELKSEFQVAELVYDPWRATQLAHQMQKKGATTVEFPQGGQHMAAGFDELLAAIKSGRFHHDGNPVLTWMANNTYAKPIRKGLVVPAKDKPDSPAKIDGIVAVTMGIARAAVADPTERSFWETQAA